LRRDGAPLNVAILAGGRSSEREVSLHTADVIAGAVRAAGHEPRVIMVERSGTWRCDGRSVCLHPGEGLLDSDVVFPALHGPFGEDGTVQGLLEVLDVPYVGAGVFASSLCMDKAAFRDVLTANGLPQVRYEVVSEQRWRQEPGDVRAAVAELRLPVFVKPARLGSSASIVKVMAASQLDAALETAYSHDGVAVVEAFSPGVEVECAVIGLATPETSVPGQIVLRGRDWHDYQAKYTRGGHSLATPAQIGDATVADVQRLARDTFLHVGCAGLARVDFFVEDDRVLVNEVNTLPGFTPTSDYPKLWEASGLALPDLCDRLLGLALERFRLERAGHTF
jgi:D-alanine-D-alanine ligase